MWRSNLVSNIVIQLVNLFHSKNTPIYKCMALYLFPKESFISSFHIWWIFIFCDVIETDWFIPSTLNCLNRLSSIIMNCTSNPSRLFTWKVRIWMILQFTFVLSFCGCHFVLKWKGKILVKIRIIPPLHFAQSIASQQLYYERLWSLYSSDNADHCCWTWPKRWKGYDKSVTLKINKPVYCPGELQIGICHGI